MRTIPSNQVMEGCEPSIMFVRVDNRMLTTPVHVSSVTWRDRVSTVLAIYIHCDLHKYDNIIIIVHNTIVTM